MFKSMLSLELSPGLPLVLSLGLLLGFTENLLADTKRPNIILIMTDDMGYSDLGCYGAEIKTPHLDQLAAEGLRFTQFYNTSRCCPTRASLLTGLYAHQAGMGGMTSDSGPNNPGYRGRLMANCVTMAEVLGSPASPGAPGVQGEAGESGYLTIQTGKWHLGEKKKAWWPTGRGFQRVFGSPAGGGFYFRPSEYKGRFVVRGEDMVYTAKIDPPKDWYTTDAYTDEGLVYVEEAVKAEKPFFWYLAYNAPHWPLKAKPADIDKYRGKYMAGWDELRQKRYQRLIEMGLIKSDWPLSPRPGNIPAWETLTDAQKKEQDERMATYAAMVDCVDQNVGKIVHTLDKLGVKENTLIAFLCDNGAASSGGPLGKNNGKPCGTSESFAFTGECWANVSNSPFQQYKTNTHEGGIATPFVVSWPAGIKTSLNGSLIHDPAHLIDLMPTFVSMAGATYPKQYKGENITPMEGESLMKVFQGGHLSSDRLLYFEHMGKRAVRQGKWKLVMENKKTWLYDMAQDRTETKDLASQYPEKVSMLREAWMDWAKRCHVLKTAKAGKTKKSKLAKKSKQPK